MALGILNNISALMVQNQLDITQANLQKTLTQLSSGSRINSGADDAAGLSIASGLQANIAALTQSCQNAASGVGLLQTADGALSQVTSLLNRATTLATEASNGGLSSDQTAAMNNEFQSILSEINSIGGSTYFNGSQVFTSNAMTPFLSDGTNNMLGGASMSVGTLTTGGLGIGTTGTSATDATNTLTLTSNVAAGSAVQIGTTTYTFQAAAPSSAGQVQIGGNIGETLQNLAAAVNGTDGVNGANASATASVSGSAITFTATASGNAGNGVTATGTLTASGGSTGSWSNLGDLSGGTDLTTAKWELDSWFTPSDGSTVTVGGTTYKFVTALSENGGAANQILIGGSGLAAVTNLGKAINGTGVAGTNYTAGTFANPNLHALAPTTNLPGQGYLGIVSVHSGAAGEADFGTPEAPGGGLFWAHMVTGTDLAPATDELTLASNLAAGSTVTIGATTYTFQTGAASSAGEVQIGGDAATTLQNLAAAVNGTDGVNGANASASASASGDTITFTAASPGSAGNNITATGALTAAGSGSAGSWSNGGALGGGVDGLPPSSDLNSTAHAQSALASVTAAINLVAQQRGTVGADINQLQASTNVVMTQVQNLSSAESAISDADMAKTVADMAKFSILESTAMAALTQADQQQQAVLKLLQQ